MFSPHQLLAASHQGFFMPKQASSIAPQVDWLMWFINAVSIFFTVLIFALVIYFAWRYRANRNPVPAPAGHNNILEAVWTIIPAIIVLLIFFFGFRGYMEMSVQPAAAHQVRVVGFKWGWTFEYRHPIDGTPIKLDRLILPEGEPVQFIMESTDVIHSLFIPSMRLKKDVVPGRFNKFWVQPTRANKANPYLLTTDEEKAAAWAAAYDVYCTEYCGTKHSKMLTKALVLSPDQYRAALIIEGDIFNKDGQPLPLEIVGETLYNRRGCNQCHSIDGKSGIGPTWKDLYGAQRQFTDGTTVVADENYIKESILYPGRKVVAPYGNVMASYLGQLNDREIAALIEYMKSVSTKHQTLGGPQSSAAE
jgi:cytochrome c oxidase subunit 2